MKKYLLGLTCGIALTATTAVYASETINAYLFPVKYVFNGQSKELANEYTTLNYNGHAYVPIRFVAENMGSTVGYDESTQIIKINYNNDESHPVNLTDNEAKDILKLLIPKAVKFYGVFNGTGSFKVDKTKTIPGEPDYAQVIDEKITSIADLKNWVEETFTKDVAQTVFYSRYLTPADGRFLLYKDYEGKLYNDTGNGGHGWAFSFLTDTAKVISQIDNVAEVELDRTLFNNPDKKLTLRIEYVNDKWMLASRLD
ncbi:hypothetical protein ASG89_18085 [Paenibacillus sp. Soil766]|uniref:stalk domain-containing protein n=1 Tax=Paenibacillus sp. Soil766 TaxID=1736404 RepID=UPI00070D5A17|nr:stalk domain-containing protein [Paenibacillus sp. Soil766]KRF06771.1 hypothetical protein ASG89_18085 [Paenibacillus sp. Soil766]